MRRALLAVLLSLGCAAAPSVSRLTEQGRMIDTIPDRPFAFGPMAIGADADLDIHRAEGAGLVHAPTLTSYLQTVGARLAAASPITGIPVRVHLLASPGFEAVATADANVYLGLGLLDLLENEDQLAAVLAHELGHVLLAHHASDTIGLWQKRSLQTAGWIAEATTSAKRIGLTPGRRLDLEEDEQQLALWINLTILSPTWNRTQELEADTIAADLLERAGYNATALVDVLELLAALGRPVVAAAPEPPPVAGRQLPHPRMPSIPAPGLALAASNAARTFAKAASDEVGGAVRDLQARVARSHPDIEERRVHAEDYILREGLADALPDLRVRPWQDALAARSTRAVLMGYEQSFSALTALDEGDLAHAREATRAAIRSPAGSHALPRYTAAQLLLRNGSRSRALMELKIGLESPEPSGLVVRSAADLLRRQGQTREGRDVLERGWRRLGQTAVLLPDLIAANRAVGDADRANELLVRCEATHPDLAISCREASRIAAR